MKINKRLTLILMFLVAVGLCSGSFFEVYMHGSGKEQLMANLSAFFSAQNNTFTAAFFSSVSSWLKIWLFLLLCPLIPPLVPVCPFICIIKGFSLGFSATMLVETFGFKGSWYIITTVLPHNLLQLPLLCIMTCCSMQFAPVIFSLLMQSIGKKLPQFSIFRMNGGRKYAGRNSSARRINKNALQNSARQYLFMYLIFMLCLIITCVFEAFLMKSLL